MVPHKFKIEDRRRKVATLLAQSMTEIEIAPELKVDQSTISRDIKALKHQICVYTMVSLDSESCHRHCSENISNKNMSLLGPHSVVITTHESYIPATPSFEQMQHKNITSTNSTQK